MVNKSHRQFLKDWRARPLSWSQYSGFHYNREAWYQSYFLQERGVASEQMDFGNVVGQSFDTANPMADIVRYDEMEYCIETKLGNIKLIGYFDSYDPREKKLREYKTSSNPTRWTQKTVDEHGQLTFYCMLLYLSQRVMPADVTIHLEYIAVEQGGDFSMRVKNRKPIVFQTRRTMHDILKLMAGIRATRKEMEKYIKEHI